MKKLILACGVGAILMSATACGKSNAASTGDAALNDSVSILFGKVIGSQFSENFARQSDGKFDKQAFLRGIQTAVAADSTQESYLQGLSTGVRFAQQFNYFSKEIGVDVDRDLFMKEFKAALTADSVADTAIDQALLNSLIERAQKAAEERKLEELNNAPEAVAGRKAGEAFIDSVKKADATVKTTASGLSYKVISEGEGAAITDNDQVAVIYKGTLTDGTVFDDSKGEARNFRPNQVVPGFGEGLKLMKKGAKYVLYIPGDLAYGVKGQPYAKIGPNQTLVFEVEVADINPSRK
ncbi:MAG: FKBP-type peptidyl-prolyl cis-trans isomerase [Muribaculum sp.]|nr:FKBP-type peptidyl-prolyl cis-trans isomerase [Muribaculum sp.]